MNKMLFYSYENGYFYLPDMEIRDLQNLFGVSSIEELWEKVYNSPTAYMVFLDEYNFVYKFNAYNFGYIDPKFFNLIDNLHTNHAEQAMNFNDSFETYMLVNPTL